MERKRRWSTAWAGIALIVLGGLFLASNWLKWDWEHLWPIFPVVGGLAFLAGWVSTGFKDEGMAFVGTGAVLVGLFFFGFTLEFWPWDDMERLWPVFPLIGGVAFLVLFFAQRRKRDWGTLGVSIAAFIVGIVGLLVTHGKMTEDIIKWWPALLVLLGLFGLVGGLIRTFRRQ